MVKPSLSPRTLLLAAGVLLPLPAAVSALWLYSAHRIPMEIDAWAERERQAGISVHWDALAVGGFPLRLQVSLLNATYGKSLRPPLYTVTTPRLIGTAWVWDWGDWSLSAPEGATLSVPASEDRLGIDASAALVTGTVSVGSGGTGIALTATTVTSGAVQAARAEARVTLPRAPATNHLDTDGTLALDVTGLTLPGDVPTLGRVIDTVSARATLKGIIPAGPTPLALAHWRDDGGTLDVELQRLAWGPLQATANGTLALDQNLQPMGALNTTVIGPGALVDAVVASGAMRASDGAFAKLALGMLSKPGADGTPEVTLPARVQNGNLYLGPARLMAMPRIAW
jgi:hypothetical protein